MAPEPQSPTATAPIRVQYQESADFLMEGLAQQPSKQVVIKPINYVIWAAIIIAIFALQLLKAAIQPAGINWVRVGWIWGPILLFAGSFMFFLHRASGPKPGVI